MSAKTGARGREQKRRYSKKDERKERWRSRKVLQMEKQVKKRREQRVERGLVRNDNKIVFCRNEK